MVHIRQPTPGAGGSDRVSPRLRHAFTDRARDLGRHAADADVIDAELGQRGAALVGRDGFEARVGPGEIGIVPSVDLARLARDCPDRAPPLDACAPQGRPIADRGGAYDPGSANGRSPLGRSVSRARSPGWSDTRSDRARRPDLWRRRRAATWR